MRSPWSLLFSKPNNPNSQPFFTGEVFQPSDHFRGPPLDLLQQVRVCPVARTPELDALLQVGSHRSTVEGENHLSWPAGHILMQPRVWFGFLGCKCTLLDHTWFFIHQYCQAAGLLPTNPSPSLHWFWGLSQPRCQELGLGFVDLHEVTYMPCRSGSLVQSEAWGIWFSLIQQARKRSTF